MDKTLELFLSAEYNLEVDKDRTLNSELYCYYYSGDTETELNYDFTFYTGATMSVKNNSGTQVMLFSTDDGSITLGVGGVLTLTKTGEEMNKVRSGVYKYDIYLSSAAWPKRGFLRGDITFYQNIAY